MSAKKIGIVMDPIEGITIHKDSSFAMLLEAQRRHKIIYYMEVRDLFLRDGIACARARRLTVKDDATQWFDYVSEEIIELGHLDILLMRKDPPVDIDYINATHLLELAAHQGVRVINNPQALRDTNEKLAACWFPQCTPPTLVSGDVPALRQFIKEQKDVVIKPLNNMGGAGVFRLGQNDPNSGSALELLTDYGKRPIMAQRFIPEINQGDKRVLLIDGTPIPYALARIPAAGELRGNLAAGATGKGRPLTKRDRWICKQVEPMLRAKGLFFVGLDIIGDYLTEINVTSPTCIRELDAAFDLNISAQLFDALEKSN